MRGWAPARAAAASRARVGSFAHHNTVELISPKRLKVKQMIFPRAVCVHDLAQARTAMGAAAALGCGVVLLSGVAAAGYTGCGWWRALIEAAGAGEDLLDCGDAAGYAMAALRIGQRGIVLSAHTPALTAVRSAARVLGATVLTARPECLDLAERGAERRLRDWLAGQANRGPGC
jgi:hypothetical protein